MALTVAIVLLTVSLMMKSFRWRSLLPTTPGISAGEAYRIFHISVLLNNLLPFRLGDGVRIVSPSVRRAATTQQALVVLVMERILDAIVLTSVAVIAVPIFLKDARRPISALGLPSFDVTPALIAAAVVALAVFLGVTLAAERHPAARDAWWRPRTRIAALRRDIALLLQLPAREVGVISMLTALLWIGTFSLHYAIFVALNVPTARVDPVTVAIVVTVATNLSMLAPATPANVGVFHAAAAAPLIVAGYPTEVAIAYAVVVHAVNTIPPMILGAACLGVPAVRQRFGGPPNAA